MTQKPTLTLIRVSSY